MNKGYNELVGIRTTISRVVPTYRLEHHYRWYCNGEPTKDGTLRGYDMHRNIPGVKILEGLRDVYAPVILSIWQRVTKTSLTEYYQFKVGATPGELGFSGTWFHWAQL